MKPLGRIEMLEQDLSVLDQKIDQTKNEIIGTADDEADVDTIKGAKQLALDLYEQSKLDNFYASQNLQNQIDYLRQYSAITSWKEVQSIIRGGQARAYFSIGDQLACQRLGETLIWDIIGIDEDTPSNSNYTHSITLQLHNCINISRLFDAPEPSNPGLSSGSTQGYSEWSVSNIRQWLNATQKENWWVKAHTYDTQPTYAGYPGFLYGMDQDFLSVIGPVNKKTLVLDGQGFAGDTYTTSDTMFFLSQSEVGGTSDTYEGTTYSYYLHNGNITFTEPDYNRIKYIINDNGYTNWWLRTPYNPAIKNSNWTLWVVMPQGQLTPVETSAGCYMAPACCIY